jgi:hypothetical protein
MPLSPSIAKESCRIRPPKTQIRRPPSRSLSGHQSLPCVSIARNGIGFCQASDVDRLRSCSPVRSRDEGPFPCELLPLHGAATDPRITPQRCPGSRIRFCASLLWILNATPSILPSMEGSMWQIQEGIISIPFWACTPRPDIFPERWGGHRRLSNQATHHLEESVLEKSSFASMMAVIELGQPA